MLSFKKGDTPTFKFVLNVPVTFIGEPSCVIVQDDSTFHLDTEIDVDENALLCHLQTEDSKNLIGGFPALIQHSWRDGVGNTIAFPAEEIYIEDVFLNIPDFGYLETESEEEQPQTNPTEEDYFEDMELNVDDGFEGESLDG